MSGFVTCRRKRVSPPTAPICGFEPRLSPNDLEPDDDGRWLQPIGSRFNSERGLQRKASGTDEESVPKTPGRDERLEGSIPSPSSNEHRSAREFLMLEKRVLDGVLQILCESPSGMGTRLQHASLRVRLPPRAPKNHSLENSRDPRNRGGVGLSHLVANEGNS